LVTEKSRGFLYPLQIGCGFISDFDSIDGLLTEPACVLDLSTVKTASLGLSARSLSNPSDKTVLEAGDIVVLMGAQDSIRRATELLVDTKVE